MKNFTTIDNIETWLLFHDFIPYLVHETDLSRLLSSPPHPVLEGLGKKLSFEIAIGINGRFWVNASQSSTVILVGNAIQKSESLSMVQQKIYLEKLLKSIQ